VRVAETRPQEYNSSMRAITVVPGDPASAELSELPDPEPGPRDLLVEPLLLGVCGTDREIVAGLHGEPPPGDERLVLGHELLARVLGPPPKPQSRRAISSPASCGDPIRSPASAVQAESGTCVETAATRSGG
jgi:threonine dehydrogenase-like Zn-dependent dehydrogenase